MSKPRWKTAACRRRHLDLRCTTCGRPDAATNSRDERHVTDALRPADLSSVDLKWRRVSSLGGATRRETRAPPSRRPTAAGDGATACGRRATGRVAERECMSGGFRVTRAVKIWSAASADSAIFSPSRAATRKRPRPLALCGSLESWTRRVGDSTIWPRSPFPQGRDQQHWSRRAVAARPLVGRNPHLCDVVGRERMSMIVDGERSTTTRPFIVTRAARRLSTVFLARIVLLSRGGRVSDRTFRVSTVVFNSSHCHLPTQGVITVTPCRRPHDDAPSRRPTPLKPARRKRRPVMMRCKWKRASTRSWTCRKLRGR